MLTKIIFALALVALVLAEEKKPQAEKTAEKTVDTKKDKRGLVDFGYGYNGLGLNSGLGVSTYTSGVEFSNYPSSYSVGHGISTVITKEVGVPVPHPVPVPVDRPVPYAVKVPYAVHVDRPYPVSVPKPYPVEVTRHVPVPVDRPVPVPVGVPVKVHVPAPYPVRVPQPYAVPIVKHVPVPVSQPIVVEKYNTGYSHGLTGYAANGGYSSW